MLAAVGLQVVSVALLALFTGAAFDWTSAKFFAIGGAAATVPNALFALRLAVHQGRPVESYPTVFLLGEFAKIGLTAGALAWIAHWEQPVSWLPLVLGLIVALKAQLFALLFVKNAPHHWPANDSDA